MSESLSKKYWLTISVRILLVSITTTAHGVSHSFSNWPKVIENEKAATFLDPEFTEKKGNITQYKIITNFKQPIFGEVRSRLEVGSIDCLNRSYSPKVYTHYQKINIGAPIEEGPVDVTPREWQVVTSSNLFSKVLDRVCK